MMEIAGISYSQIARGDKKSHAQSRHTIVAEAVRDYRKNGDSLEACLKRRVAHHKYDENMPSRVK
jgi:hypothetical protein